MRSENPGMIRTNVEPLRTRVARHLLVTGFFLLSAGFLLLSSASAQSTGGAKGKVRNLNDQGIPNATISARQKGVDIKSTKSDAKGTFVLDGLEPGIYNLAFEARGYSAAVQYNVEIKKGNIRDLGDRLILMVDRGSRVIIRGSVFFKDGYIANGAKIIIERVNGDGSVKKLGETGTDAQGEFNFSQPEGLAKIRIKAAFKDGKAVKDVEVDSPMVYRTALSLDIERPKPD